MPSPRQERHKSTPRPFPGINRLAGASHAPTMSNLLRSQTVAAIRRIGAATSISTECPSRNAPSGDRRTGRARRVVKLIAWPDQASTPKIDRQPERCVDGCLRVTS